MKKVTLIFPDTAALRQFIYDYRLLMPEVRPYQIRLIAALSDQLIIDACIRYKAEIGLVLHSPEIVFQ